MTLPNSQIERHLGITTMLRALATIAAAAAMLASAHAQDGAADYPNKPVKIMVTVPAGGGVDTVTRIISEKLQQRWGQPVVIENRAGAGGNIAAEAISAAEPDGYTLMASQPAPITTNVFLHKKLNFDPSEIEPIVVMSKIPNVLLVRPDFPAKTAQQFMEYARKNPGKLSYASQGVGTTSHLTAELFQTLTKTKLVHVPYKGTGPALNDLLGSHVDFIFMQLESAIKLHEGGKARILAVTTDKRLPLLPDLPTMAEVGVPNLVSDTWNAISAPPKTPAAIVAKVNAAVNEVLKQPDVQARFTSLHLLPGGGSAQETKSFVTEETKRWGEVIRAANVTPM
jgi:tripartite-type tricarboxylate transporter receptor subunit TctC